MIRPTEGRRADLDADAARQIAHSFLVVRVLRGSLLLVFLALALLGVVARGWPDGVALAVGAAMLVQAGTLSANVRRLRSSRRPAVSR